MSWQQFDRFWGYGDPKPKLLVLTDSCVQMRGPLGKRDATTILQWMLSMHVGPTMVVKQNCARAHYEDHSGGDYLSMMYATRDLGCSTTLMVSMGNDLYDDVPPANKIAAGLQKVLM